MTIHNTASRREFLKRAAAFSVLGGAAPFALNLASVSALAAEPSSEYRALVCFFLFGGNDHNNMVVPFDAASYAAYQASRPGLEIAMPYLQEIVPGTSQGAGLRFALPNYMSGLQGLFQSGKAAILANVGTLLAPVTLADYKARRNLPPKLFSHNDQTATWQAFTPEGSKVGWGGRMGDLLASMNTDTTFTAISASGNAVYLTGRNVLQYQVGANGSTNINAAVSSSVFGSTLGDDALRLLSMQTSNHLLEADHAAVVKRSFDAAAKVQAALATAPATDVDVALPTALANDNLAKQMQVIARLIKVRSQLGARRQVFFVGLGGFDTHDNELTAQATLLARVSQVIEYFYNSTVAQGVANQVTLFTGSDFGRTLASNGKGSDHAWGAHHFIVGGAVKGKDIYGSFPQVRIGTTANPNPLDTGSGRFIPTTSVDQYAATLARWFGVADSDMASVIPNIGNFSTRYLNFL